MPTLQFGGLVSGLSTKDIIDGLMQAESQGLRQLQSRKALYTSRRDAYGKLKTLLGDLLARLLQLELEREPEPRILGQSPVETLPDDADRRGDRALARQRRDVHRLPASIAV